MRKTVFLSCLFFLLGTWNAQAWVENVEKLAEAEPAECYAGAGGLRVDPVSEDPFTCPDIDDPATPDVVEVAIPYTPQTYVWSLVQHDNFLWFGTGANVLCTTSGAFFSDVNPGSAAQEGDSLCEYGDSWVLEALPNLPGAYGDWRPPKMYQYNLNTGRLIDRTPYTDRLRNYSMGLRSAGTHDGVTFLAGGTLGGGITMFAYNAETGEYLGSKRFREYRTIRKWLVVDGQLYTGAGTSYAGQMLRWDGDISDLWNFTQVGQISGAPRELTEYIDGDGKTRIAVTGKGVFLSPPVENGLNQYSNWMTIWSANQYEPDFVTRTTYIGGGIASVNGTLIFGTMHIPGNAYDLHSTCIIQPFGFELPSSICMGVPQSEEEQSAAYYGTSRATSIWMIRNAESNNRETQLLYGEAQLGAYDAATRTFPYVDNLGGYSPVFGTSGFANYYNNYSWTAVAVDNHIFIGTMDVSSLWYDPGESPIGGADLWRIDIDDNGNPSAAVAETTSAFEVESPSLYAYPPYGFRTLIKSLDGTKLYAGMAAGVNVGAVGEGAGFQLLELDSVPAEPAVTASE